MVDARCSRKSASGIAQNKTSGSAPTCSVDLHSWQSETTCVFAYEAGGRHWHPLPHSSGAAEACVQGCAAAAMAAAATAMVTVTVQGGRSGRSKHKDSCVHAPLVAAYPERTHVQPRGAAHSSGDHHGKCPRLHLQRGGSFSYMHNSFLFEIIINRQ